MLPLLGALIGGGASLAGSIIGANAQDDAAAMNAYVNMLNYYARERERSDRIREATKSDREKKEGFTSADGSRQRYVPGKGWVTELSAQAKAINDAQMVEQERAAKQDAPERRAAMYRNIARQKNEGDLADAKLAQSRYATELPGDAAKRYATMAAAGANNQYDALVNSAMRKAVRTGSSNTGSILASMAKARAKAAGDASAEAYMTGEDAGTKNATARTGNLMNLYSMLAARASGKIDANYAPQNITGAADNNLARAMGRGDDATNQLIAAMGQRGGTMDYIEPNMGWANAISSGGQAVGSTLSNIGKYYANSMAGGNAGFSPSGNYLGELY